MFVAFDHLAKASSANTLIPGEIRRDNFMQDATEPVARPAWEQLLSEPNQVDLDKLDLKRFYSLAAPKGVIHCRQDQGAAVRIFHPCMSSRLGACKLP